METPSARLQVQWLVEKRWTHWLWVFAGISVVGYIAYVARDIWLPMAVAFLVAMVLDPVVDRLEARGWSRTWGAILIFGGFLLVGAAVLFFAVPALIVQGERLNQDFNQYLPDRSPQGVQKALDAHHVNPTVTTLAVRASEQLQSSIQESGKWFASNGMKIASNLIWIVIIPIVAFYALKDFHLILAKTFLLVPRKHRDRMQSLIAEVTVIFAKYMRGLMTVALLDGVATWLLLQILGVPNAFMLGCVAGLLYSVPYIGALTTILLVAVVSFIGGGLNFMLIVVGANVVLHQVIFDQIISPRILGGHVGLHPIFSIMALLVGNELMGIVGMVLAVPVAASIQVAILALVPKLSQEIDLSIPAPVTPESKDPEKTAQHAADTPNPQAKADITDELHKGVQEAVAQAEAALELQGADDQSLVESKPLSEEPEAPVQVVQIQPIAGTPEATEPS